MIELGYFWHPFHARIWFSSVLSFSETIRVWELDLPNRKLRPAECQTGQLRRVITSLKVSISHNDLAELSSSLQGRDRLWALTVMLRMLIMTAWWHRGCYMLAHGRWSSTGALSWEKSFECFRREAACTLVRGSREFNFCFKVFGWKTFYTDPCECWCESSGCVPWG